MPDSMLCVMKMEHERAITVLIAPAFWYNHSNHHMMRGIGPLFPEEA